MSSHLPSLWDCRALVMTASVLWPSMPVTMGVRLLMMESTNSSITPLVVWWVLVYSLVLISNNVQVFCFKVF